MNLNPSDAQNKALVREFTNALRTIIDNFPDSTWTIKRNKNGEGGYVTMTIPISSLFYNYLKQETDIKETT